MLLELSDPVGDAIVIDDEVLFFKILDRVSLFIGDIDLDKFQGHSDFILLRKLLLPDVRLGRKSKEEGN